MSEVQSHSNPHFQVKLFGFLLLKERAGVISPAPIWICFHSCYMYNGDTLAKCLWAVISQWKDDRNLVG
jgi:hypothetical protein